MRISRDQMLMSMAQIVAKRSTCIRGQVGAVIAYEGRIISMGYNGAPSGLPHCTPLNCNKENPCSTTVHAEANAIVFAAKYGLQLSDATLYCNYSPCKACSQLIINSGIIEIVFQKEYRVREGLLLMQQADIMIRQLDDNI
ncbi:MAG: dCMP deaminase family protein [Nitrosopumilus sp.]